MTASECAQRLLNARKQPHAPPSGCIWPPLCMKPSCSLMGTAVCSKACDHSMLHADWRCSWEEVAPSPGLFRRAQGSCIPAEITVQLPQASRIWWKAANGLHTACRRCRRRCLLVAHDPPPPLPSFTQGTIGLQLHSSARVWEMYSAAPDGTPSYVCTCRGTQLPGQQLWVLEHTWAQAWLVPPVVRLRLFSLVDRDELRLASLQLLPAPQLQSSAAPAGPAASSGGAVSGAEWAELWEASNGGAAAAVQLPPAPSAAAHGAPTAAAPAAASAATVAAAAAAAPPAAAAAAGGSQIDEVRQMLSRLVVEEAGRRQGDGQAADPKRALMVSLANAVLRQPAAPAAQQLPNEPASAQAGLQQQQQPQAPSLLQQAAPLLDEWRRRQQQQERQQQQMAEALGLLERRVAAVESLCHEMHGMLRQLVAQQQRTKQPMRAGVAGLGMM